MKGPRKLNRITATCLLLCVCSASLIITGNSNAQAGSAVSPSGIDKLSPDLRAAMETTNGKLRVIVKTNSNQFNLVSTILSLGGTVLSTFSKLNLQLVDLPVTSADALAADDNIAYVSLDNTVRSFGHVVTTSGAQQSRQQK